MTGFHVRSVADNQMHTYKCVFWGDCHIQNLEILQSSISDSASTLSLYFAVHLHRQVGDLQDQSAISFLCINNRWHWAVTSFLLCDMESLRLDSIC